VLELSGYTNLVLIGEGGLGRVYRGVRISTGGVVAIKELHDVAAASPVWHRAVREVEAMLRLKSHPYVVSVEEIVAGTTGPCIVMEYLAGGSLHDRMQASPLSVPETLLVGHHVAQALAAAHSVGVVHRDVKPHNLLIGGFGQVKVADFGIASILRDSGVRTLTQALTLAYASPEELDGAHDVGPPTDVYSLAATLSHLTTGIKPSFRDRVPATLSFASNTALRPLATALYDAMATDPTARPTMAELVAAFDQANGTLGSAKLTALAVHSAGSAPPTQFGDTVVRAPNTAATAPTVVRPPPPPTLAPLTNVATPTDVSRGSEPPRRILIVALVAISALLAVAVGAGIVAFAWSDRQGAQPADISTSEVVTSEVVTSEVVTSEFVTSEVVTSEASVVSVTPAAEAPVAVTNTPSTVALTAPPLAVTTVTLNCNHCRLRSSPTTVGSDIVAELKNSMGAPVQVLRGDGGGWVEVSVSGKSGWLFGTFTWPVPNGFVLGEQSGEIQLLDSDGLALGIENPTGNKVLITRLSDGLHTVLLPDGTIAYVSASTPTRR